jgi:integrase
MYNANKSKQKRHPVYSANWYVELKDHNDVVRFFAGYPDKRQTMLFGQQLQRLINCKRMGEKPDGQLIPFIDGMSPKLRQRLVDLDLLDRPIAEAGKPLSKHLDDFFQSLLAKEDTVKQAKQTTSRAARIVAGCGFQTFNSIQPNQVTNYLKKLRQQQNISARTSNFYLNALRQFCSWMVRNRRATVSPLEAIERLDRNTVKNDERHPRRPLTIQQAKRLLAVTETQPTRLKMTGHQRAVLYMVAIETGIREDELRTLTVDAIDFANLTITIEAKHAKSRRKDVVPIRRQTATSLKQLTANKMPNTKVFNVPEKAVKVLREDLAAADIPYCDENGRYVDFHSFRHTTASFLAAGGVQPKVAQTIMRHRDIRTTMDIYTHTMTGQEHKAVEQGLPDLSPSKDTGQAVNAG